jgi:hypothetical protein
MRQAPIENDQQLDLYKRHRATFRAVAISPDEKLNPDGDIDPLLVSAMRVSAASMADEFDEAIEAYEAKKKTVITPEGGKNG